MDGKTDGGTEGMGQYESWVGTGWDEAGWAGRDGQDGEMTRIIRQFRYQTDREMLAFFTVTTAVTTSKKQGSKHSKISKQIVPKTSENHKNPPWNAPKSRPRASKIEPGAIQDAIFLKHLS